MFSFGIWHSGSYLYVLFSSSFCICLSKVHVQILKSYSCNCREYVRQMQMSKSMSCSLSDEHINSPLVTAKTYRQWNCKGCWDKLEPLYNTTPTRPLNEFARVPEHAVCKELSREKGSAKCHSPSSYNKESTEVDQAVNGTSGSLGEFPFFLLYKQANLSALSPQICMSQHRLIRRTVLRNTFHLLGATKNPQMVIPS